MVLSLLQPRALPRLPPSSKGDSFRLRKKGNASLKCAPSGNEDNSLYMCPQCWHRAARWAGQPGRRARHRRGVGSRGCLADASVLAKAALLPWAPDRRQATQAAGRHSARQGPAGTGVRSPPAGPGSPLSNFLQCELAFTLGLSCCPKFCFVCFHQIPV